jgi:hypothetical protein
MFKTILVILSLLVICMEGSQSLAAIPTANTIFNRYTHNNGKTGYIVEQEVQFQTEPDAPVLREKWIIENANTMYLIVNGEQAGSAHMEVLYKDGRRIYFDNLGSVKSAPSSAEFIEPYLYYRTSRSLLDALLRSKVLPSGFSLEKPRIGKIEGYLPQPENYVQLARSGGVITYQFGELTPVSSEKLNPSFWIDQDSFLFRRIRFPSQAEVVADKHAQFAGGIHLPRERSLNWGNHSVLIRVLSVKVLGAKTPKTWFSTNYLTGRAGAANALKLPNSPQVSEFYSRFR